MADFDAGDVRLEDPEADRLMVSTPQLWLYLPKLLYYPVRGYALGTVIVMGALIWLAGYSGVFGLALAGVVFGWMSYYSMGVVERTATGHAIPPPFGTEVLFQGEKLRLGLLVIYIATVLMMALAATRPGSPGWGVVVFIAGVYLFPAFLASLALQPDLLSAMNPWTSIRFVLHTGLPYLIACLVLAGVGFLAVILAGHVGSVISSMLLVYTLLFICHLIGYVAYHRQDEIGLAVSVTRPTPELTAALEQAERVKEVLAEVDRCLASREPRTARDVLMADDGSELMNPRGFHEDLFEGLRQRHQDALSLVQAGRLIQLLAQEKRYPRALDIWEQCLDFAKDFVPEPASLAGTLAEQALKDKRMALFTRLDAAVRTRQPQGEAVVALQFLKAQALVSQKQDAAALALLTPLLSASTHPWASRIQALHKALAGMQGRT